MTSKIINTGSLLRLQRKFPNEVIALSTEVDRAYVQIANKVNDRVIGFYSVGAAVITGEKWSMNGITYTGFRQVYSFTAAGNIPHNLDVTSVIAFTKIFGAFQDASTPPQFYPLPYVDVLSITNQINVSIDSTNIIITAGAGAPPSVSKGYVVLEWIS
jgi:hypothetical protein